MAEGHALSHGWAMRQQKTRSPGLPTHGTAGVLGYGLAVALVVTGILGLELSAGLGWALIVLGGWFAALTSQRVEPRSAGARRPWALRVDRCSVDPSATMEDRSRINAQNHALPPPCARATIRGRPTNGPTNATLWITPNKERTANMTSHHDAPTTPDAPFASPTRRFSEGMERMPPAPSSSRVGRFSDGLARLPRSASAQRSGSFADGLAQPPYDRSARRVGSFSDGFERGGRDPETAPRVDSPRSTEEGRIAA